MTLPNGKYKTAAGFTLEISAKEWKRFQACLALPTFELMAIPLNRIGACAYQPCGQKFVRWSWNKKYCSRRCKDKNRRER